MQALVMQGEISSKILTLRGQQVMLDRDLAELYGVETKRLNEQVKRNIERFSDDFMFQLNEKEKKEPVTNCDRFKKALNELIASSELAEEKVMGFLK